MTATANDGVARDILTRLGIPRAGLVDTGSYRPNLHYAVEQLASEEDRLRRLLELVRATEGSGIVYTATVRAAEAVHDALIAAGESAGLYHGKRRAAERRAGQDAFMHGEVRVMVATNAFGMGIDKPDIRFVLHHQLPSGLDAYYQESGRAGRNGAVAQCTLLFLPRDKAVQQFFLAGRYPEKNELDALYRALHEGPAKAHGWTLASLQRHLGNARSKVQVALGLLRQRRVVREDREGSLTLQRRDLGADELDAMLTGYRRKREQDHATLEGMVFYAQTGRCRWQVLLAHLEEEALAQTCGTCDNCVRIARHAQEMARPIVLHEEDGAGLKKSDRPLFTPADAVKVRRYGPGTVVSADSHSVTVEFSDGSRRSFQPDFVQSVRGRRTACL